jgi:hypothetical protein
MKFFVILAAIILIVVSSPIDVCSHTNKLGFHDLLLKPNRTKEEEQWLKDEIDEMIRTQILCYNLPDIPESKLPIYEDPTLRPDSYIEYFEQTQQEADETISEWEQAMNDARYDPEPAMEEKYYELVKMSHEMKNLMASYEENEERHKKNTIIMNELMDAVTVQKKVYDAFMNTIEENINLYSKLAIDQETQDYFRRCFIVNSGDYNTEIMKKPNC